MANGGEWFDSSHIAKTIFHRIPSARPVENIRSEGGGYYVLNHNEQRDDGMDLVFRWCIQKKKKASLYSQCVSAKWYALFAYRRRILQM